MAIDTSNVLAILVADIDREIQLLSDYRSGHVHVSCNKIPLTKLSKALQKKIEQEKALAEQIAQLNNTRGKLIDSIRKSMPEAYEFDYRGVVRETLRTAYERVEGTAKKRAEKRARLQEIRASVIAVAAQGRDLSSWVLDFNREFPARKRGED